jgi:chorismate dehydratase
MRLNPGTDSRLRIAAIDFLNPAPLMWDFEHPPIDAALARRYRIDRMAPSECAARLIDGTADLGLIPIAALAFAPQLRVLPGCTIASKARVRSLILVRRASQAIGEIRSVAADTASRTTIAYTRTLFHKWRNPAAVFVPLAADLDRMLEQADAAVVIGDPALLALEERANRFVRTGEELVYHDIAQEWISLTGLPYISAVWAASPACQPDEGVANDFIQSRIHGCQNVEALVAEWSKRLPIPAETIRYYLTTNIHYALDEECIEGMQGFFRMAAEAGVLPEAKIMLPDPAAV